MSNFIARVLYTLVAICIVVGFFTDLTMTLVVAFYVCVALLLVWYSKRKKP